MDRYEAQIRGFCIEGWLIQERFIEGRSTLYGQGKVGGILFISQDQLDKEPGPSFFKVTNDFRRQLRIFSDFET